MNPEPATDEPPPLLFDAVLRPHRSLSPAGFYILMAMIGGISFIAGIAFVLIGAWPIFGFFGLDVLAIYVAFRLSYRSGRLTERVQISPDHLMVSRVQPNGRITSWQFQPYWVRVLLERGPDGEGEVTLTSHGRSVGLGRFLTPGEREDFAGALKAALAEARQA